jgi:hypothetical protein
MAETAELRDRYERAYEALAGRGLEAVGRDFESAIETARAVLSVPLDFALLLLRGNTLHQNYYRGVAGQSRQSAARDDDVARRSIDAKLFGRIAEDLTMAALSLDGRGLRSYGQVFLEFRELVCRHRASLLVDNSFVFHRRYGGDRQELPKGFRATWSERGRLALIKVAEDLAASTTSTAYPELLMGDAGDRALDRFVEVHIYGAWDHQAIFRVRGPRVFSTDYENFQLQELRARLDRLGIPWEDLV